MVTDRTAPVHRLPIVGVMGSGTDEHRDVAEPLGVWLATIGVHLLTGGGGGVMAAVSRAFVSVEGRRGAAIGILPADPLGGDPIPRRGYPNPWVEIPIFTHLPLTGAQGSDARSRNHINILSSDVVVALPGGPGTCSEIELAVRYGRPIVVMGQPVLDERLLRRVALVRSLEHVQRFVLHHLAGRVPDRAAC